MPITVILPNYAGPIRDFQAASSDADLLQRASPQEFSKSKGIVQSSFPPSTFLRDGAAAAEGGGGGGGGGGEAYIVPSENGFISAAYQAYSQHNHLSIRPEDVWFAILSQLSFYINAHADELRDYFVAHEGQKEVEVIEFGTRQSVDFGLIAEKMTTLMQQHVRDPGLRAWALPAFSTTTDSDRAVAAVLLMGSLQKYFTYKAKLICGLPSVTLRGERDDWVEVQRRLDTLDTLGAEPQRFAALLRPILRYFLASFDDPTADAVQTFWSKIAHQTGGSGPYHLSGWITAFAFWDEEGRSLYDGKGKHGPQAPVSLESFEGERAGCELDGTLYHRVDTDHVPAGSASVPVTVDDNGVVFETRMLAGSVGWRASSSGGVVYDVRQHQGDGVVQMQPDGSFVPYIPPPPEPLTAPGLDSIEPVSGWWIYEVDSSDKQAAGHNAFLSAYSSWLRPVEQFYSLFNSLPFSWSSNLSLPGYVAA